VESLASKTLIFAMIGKKRSQEVRKNTGKRKKEEATISECRIKGKKEKDLLLGK